MTQTQEYFLLYASLKFLIFGICNCIIDESTYNKKFKVLTVNKAKNVSELRKKKCEIFYYHEIREIGQYISHSDQAYLPEIKMRFSFTDFLNCLTICYFSKRIYSEIIELWFNECTWR